MVKTNFALVQIWIDSCYDVQETNYASWIKDRPLCAQ